MFHYSQVINGNPNSFIHPQTAAELVEYNPLLKNYTPTTRLAYAKFKSFALKGYLKHHQTLAIDGNKRPLAAATFNEVNESAGNGLQRPPPQNYRFQSLWERAASMKQSMDGDPKEGLWMGPEVCLCFLVQYSAPNVNSSIEIGT